LNYAKEEELIELRQIGLGSTSEFGPNEERKFTLIGPIDSTPLNSTLNLSHSRCNTMPPSPRLSLETLASSKFLNVGIGNVHPSNSLQQKSTLRLVHEEDALQCKDTNECKGTPSKKQTLNYVVEEDKTKCPSATRVHIQGKTQ
jgi:hypothetical protein